MVFTLVLFALDALLFHPSSEALEDEVMVCDDGSPAWRSDGEPNWSCVRKGCTPHASSCWADQLDHCYRDDGTDLGICVRKQKTCNNQWACFELWLYCDGTYECHESGNVGCKRGTCTTAETKSQDSLLNP